MSERDTFHKEMEKLQDEVSRFRKYQVIDRMIIGLSNFEWINIYVICVVTRSLKQEKQKSKKTRSEES